MTKFSIITFVIVLTGLGVSTMFKDEKRQCDGKTKTYASMGKMYACQNFMEP